MPAGAGAAWASRGLSPKLMAPQIPIRASCVLCIVAPFHVLSVLSVAALSSAFLLSAAIADRADAARKWLFGVGAAHAFGQIEALRG